MRYLLVASYSGSFSDDNELTTNTYSVGMYDNLTNLYQAVSDEITNYISEEVHARYSEEDEEEIECLKGEFNVALYKKTIPLCLDMVLLGEVSRLNDYEQESLKLYGIVVGL